ncbi:MAG TPA: carbohydrate kinase family protein [Caldilineaceae bacterium]|nr:carbohydrate kinase family protein [Caldilineaceae bacterium]
MRSTPPTAVVAGHICLDIIPTFDARQSPSGPLLEPGKLIHVGPPTLATGGAVSNTGLALHRLGITTRLMGKIGDDLFGRAILDIICSRDAALAAGMIRSGSPSSYTIVINPPGLDRSFLHCPGANDTFGADDVDLAQVASADLFHFGYPPLMRRMYEDGGRELITLLARVKAQGVATSLDMAHVDVDAPAGRTDWTALLQRVLPSVDFFLPNLEEALFVVDRPRSERLAATGSEELLALAGLPLLRELGDRLLALGAAVVGLKLGDQGLYLRTTPDGARLAQAGRLRLDERWTGRELLAPAFQVKVAGTTGAGDCAIAGFLAAVLRGLGPEAALSAAVGAGACNVEAPDAISGMPTWDALQSRLAGGWAQTPLRVPLSEWQPSAQGHCWAGPNDRTHGGSTLPRL